MSKLFLFVLVLIVIYMVRKSVCKDARATDSAATGRRPDKVETVSECMHCGLLVPESEGMRSAVGFFCCAEHMQLGPRDKK